MQGKKDKFQIRQQVQPKKAWIDCFWVYLYAIWNEERR